MSHCPLAFDLHPFAYIGLCPLYSDGCAGDVDNREIKNLGIDSGIKKKAFGV